MGEVLLQIENLKVSTGGTVILEGLDLTICAGEIHVLMGHNGAGKSTLGATVMGSPVFEVEEGTVRFDGTDITDESADARARLGLFLSFQAPQEIPGITLRNFLRVAKGAISGETPRVLPFYRELDAAMAELDMAPEYATRDVNVGFSGGERKKSEVLQMLMLQPKLAILDETDSGLDVDAVRAVSAGLKKFHNKDNALLIITHNAKLVEDIEVDKVHILGDRKIVQTGGRELMDKILAQGYATAGEEAQGAAEQVGEAVR